jgi:peptidoglycan/LPS O-acetylase OafA/YrhL
MPAPRLAALDVLRFAAASMVMMFHLGYWSWAVPPKRSTQASILLGATAYPEIASLTSWGWVGVPIFFVVSGFVIAYSANRATAWSFARSRVLRLVPAALICATITLAVAVAIQWKPLSALLAAYARTVAFIPFGPWIDGVYWTLGVEVAFYAIVFVLLAIRRLSWLPPVIALIGIVSASLWLVSYGLYGTKPLIPFPVEPGRITQLTLMQHGMYFAAGVFIWLGASYGWTRRRAMVATVMTAAGLLPIAQGAADPLVPALVYLTSVAIVVSATRLDNLARQLPSPWLSAIRTLGLATYPLYLIHCVVGAALLATLIRSGVERYLALGLTAITVVAASVLLTVTAEPFVRSLLAQGLGKLQCSRPPLVSWLSSQGWGTGREPNPF